eukprot:GHUV01014564.1.p1 GENE.GHUV01014564.1~~GHUV01014564.1.p1  ORF type:complete len:640 (+),score=119.21 GHUV01014564.1:1050-2969(+)
MITTTNGTTCRIVDTRYDRVVCLTDPALSPAAAATGSSGSVSGSIPGVGTVWPGGLVVGPRGWIYDVFVNNRTNTLTPAQLSQAASWSVTAPTYNGTRWLFTDVFQGRNDSTSNHVSRALGFFMAPKTGSYRFTLIGDDLYQLQGMYHNGTAWRLDNLVGTPSPIWSYCAMYEWGCVKSACGSGQCTSGAVSLQAGQPLLLAVKQWNGQSIGSWQVGVRIPSSDPGFFSIAEVQQVTIPYTPVPHSQTLSVLFRPPADAGLDVVITVDPNAAAAATAVGAAAPGLNGVLAVLNSPRIGVNITVRGVQIPAFNPNISASALQSSINSALRAGISNSSRLGVEIKTNTDLGTLTYRLLTNRTAFPDDLMSSDVTAQIVVLPDQANATSAGSGSTGTSDGSGDLRSLQYCLQRSTEPRTVNYTNADGTISSMVVYEDVWENVTVISSNSSSNGTAAAAGPAIVAANQSLAGISISVLEVPGYMISGGKPQGVWQLLLGANTDGAIDLSWDVTSSNLLTALRVLQSSVSVRCRDPALSDNCAWREGTLTGRSWVIYWPVGSQDNVTHFSAQPKPGGYAPDNMVTSSGLYTLAQPPLLGGLVVGFDVYCDTVNISVTDTAYGAANKLNSLPGIQGGYWVCHSTA